MYKICFLTGDARRAQEAGAAAIEQIKSPKS